MKRLRIFVASPSDMATERAHVENIAAQLRPLADHLDFALDVKDWSAVVPDMGRPEQAILDQLKPTEWDLFIGILWHRFGTPPGDRDAETQKEYLSGTEEEFKTAYRLWKQHGKPRIMIYRCMRNVPLDALDPEQFKLVKDFFAEFQAVKGEHPGLYQSFETTEAFDNLLRDNLQKLLLQYGEQLAGKPIPPEVVQEFAPKVPDNLPRRASFFGREREMELVMRALSPADRTWGALIDGIGGIGKSALAVEAAHLYKESGLFEAFVFVSAKQNILDPKGIRELKPAARTLDEFLNETARVLGQIGIAKMTGDEKRRALLDALRSTRTLLIYDNLETLTKEEQESIADFLRELPTGCKALITSRRRGGEGAVWLRLEKLDWEGARQIIAEEAEKDAGLAAKLRRAGETRWRELYDETKGSPLALVHVLGLMRVRASLSFDAALDMLRGNLDSDLQEFIFQEARRELTANDVMALCALSFFAPFATFDAWAQVSNLSRNALEMTIDRLSALSLVDILPGEERYTLHPLTRNFVRDELLANSKTAHEVDMRFAKYWVNYAKKYGGWDENYETFNLLEIDWENLNAAAELLWRTSEVQGDKVGNNEAARQLSDLSKALCDACGPLFFVGRWDESLHLSSRAYAAARAMKNWNSVGWHAYQAAWIQYHRDNVDAASQWVDYCAKAWESEGNELERAFCTRFRGLLAQARRHYDNAERHYQEALSSFSKSKSTKEIARVLYILAGLERARKQYDKMERYYTEAHKLAEESENKELKAGIAANLGLAAVERERWAEARCWFEKLLPTAREIGRQDLIANGYFGLACVLEADGRHEQALSFALNAHAIQDRLQDRNLASTHNLIERLKKKLEEEQPPRE